MRYRANLVCHLKGAILDGMCLNTPQHCHFAPTTRPLDPAEPPATVGRQFLSQGLRAIQMTNSFSVKMIGFSIMICWSSLGSAALQHAVVLLSMPGRPDAYSRGHRTSGPAH